MRIVYREAPEKFRILRNVDHLHPTHAALNTEYEAWQKHYIETRPKVLRPLIKSKTSMQLDAMNRRKMYQR